MPDAGTGSSLGQAECDAARLAGTKQCLRKVAPAKRRLPAPNWDARQQGRSPCCAGTAPQRLVAAWYGSAEQGVYLGKLIMQTLIGRLRDQLMKQKSS